MITSIRMQNFQNHTDTVIEFDAGVNVIAGSSNHGKSAVMRAFEWVAFNRPSGVGFIRRGQKTCTVTVQCDDAPPVTRMRDRKGKNVYLVGDVEYSAVRTDVPEEVSAILGLTDANIQAQFGKYYLLQDSPGEVAHQINRATNCDIIDDVFVETKRRLNIIEMKMEDNDDKIALHKKAMAKYKNLEIIERRAASLETCILAFGKQQGVITRIGDLVTRHENIEASARAAAEVLKHEKAVNELTQLIEASSGLLSEKSALESLVTAHDEAVAQEEDTAQWLLVEKDCAELADLVNKMTQVRNQKSVLMQVIGQYDARAPKLAKTQLSIITASQQLVELKSQFTVCPFCNTNLSGTDHELLQHTNCS